MQKKRQRLFYVMFALSAFFVLFLATVFIFRTTIAEQIDFFISSPREYEDTIHIPFDTPENFYHNVERAYFSKQGVETKFYNSRAELITLNVIEVPNRVVITDMIEDAQKPTGTAIFYQMSPDNEQWYYYDGAAWKVVGACDNCANTATELKQAFNDTTVTGNIHIKIILESTQRNKPLLHGIDFLLAEEKSGNGAMVRSAISAVMHRMVGIFDTFIPTSVYAQTDDSINTEAPQQTEAPAEVPQQIEAPIEPTVLPETNTEPQEETPEETNTQQPVEESQVETIETVEESTPEIQPDTSKTKEKKTKPPEYNIYPLLECVSDNGDDSYTAYFGYASEYGEPIDIPVGSSNKFAPNPQDRGQVTTFQPGESNPYPDYAFSVLFSEKKITWSIKSPDGKNQKVDASSDGSSVACPSNWDGSHLEVTGECLPPAVRFTITNSGDGEMDGTSIYRIYRNDLFEDTQTVPILASGASTTIDISADGSPILIEVDQRPDHPTGGFVSARVEGCEPQQPPNAMDDTAETQINTPIYIDVLANDNDVDGAIDNATLTITEDPQQGTATVTTSTERQIMYTPETDFYGSDTIVYQICDNDALCSTATVEIFVLAPPHANDDNFSVAQGEEKDFLVLNNDTDVDGILLPESLQITASSTHGVALADTTNGTITYVSDNDFYGTDELTYRVCDDDGLCDTGDLVITVLAPPIASNDNTAVISGQAKNIDVLLNDTDPDGLINPESLALTSNPMHGNAEINNGLIVYTSTNGYSGEDTLTYQICDTYALCDEASVFITVIQQTEEQAAGGTGGGLPFFPPKAIPDTAATMQNTLVNIPVLTNDFDLDNTLDFLTLSVLVEPVHGQAVANTDNGTIAYTPTRDFFGSDTFTYTICDITNLCSNTTATVSVLASPIAFDDAVEIENSKQFFVLTNDTDPDGTLDSDTLRILTAPGDNFSESEPFAVAEHGTPSVETDGAIRYTPDTGYVGEDHFFYEICDNDGLCDVAMVRVSIGQSAPPIAQPDNGIVQQGHTITLPITQNDEAVNGTLLLTTLSLITLPGHGDASINTTNGSLTYTANTDYLGSDTLVYRICDNIGLCTQGTVSISIEAPRPQTTISKTPTPQAPSLFIAPVSLTTVSEVATSPEITILPDICGTRFTEKTFTVRGTFTGDPNNVQRFEYSITDGVSWNPIGDEQTQAGNTTLSVPFSDLQSKKYILRMRAILDDGAAIASEGCPFTVDRGLVVASVQYLSEETGSTPIHIENNTPLQVGEREQIFLEAKGADQVNIAVEQTDERIPLSYNETLKLWQGNIRFDTPGQYQLSVEAQNDVASYKRKLNTVIVKDTENIRSANGNSVDNVLLSIYRKDPNTQTFSLWEDASNQIQNPTLTNKNFSRVFSPGTYYIEAEKNGYATKTSHIFTVEEPSLVTTDIVLDKQTVPNAISTFLTGSSITKPLIVSIRPTESVMAMNVDNRLPNIRMITPDGQQTDIATIRQGKPAILMVFNTWSIDTKNTLQSFATISNMYGNNIVFIPVATLESPSAVKAYIKRGQYDVSFYLPDDSFFGQYNVTEVPVFYAISPQGTLADIITGPRSEAGLKKFIAQTFPTI